MRQVVGFLGAIENAWADDLYYKILSYRAYSQTDLPSLEEFKSSVLKNTKEPTQVFDQTTDKFLEEQALKRFLEKGGKNGK